MVKLKARVPVMNLRTFTSDAGYNAHAVPKLHISIKRNHDMIKMPTKRGQMLLWLTALFFKNRLLISSSFCALETAPETCFRCMQGRKKKSPWIFGAFPSFEVLDGDLGVDTALAVG